MNGAKGMSYYFAINLSFSAMVLLSPLMVMAQSKPVNKVDEKESAVKVKAREETEWMQEELGLSNPQYDKVTVINLSFAHRLDSIDHIPDTRSRQILRDSCQKEKDSNLKGVLNAQQYKAYFAGKGKKHVPAKSPFGSSY